MAYLTLKLAAYHRGMDVYERVRQYHWSFFIVTSIEAHTYGIAHQLRGMPGAFFYRGPEPGVALDKSSMLKHELDVGEIEASKIDRVHEILSTVSIDQVESSGWNCQNWAIDGFLKLQQEGLAYDHLTVEQIKNWFREA
ncbi:hypothetical protein BDZ85DRAFT_110478 [Elsinoe ampelina]|uniref:Uncharacterized protein n=1 Tax=Elsinoe ampelina TaxID=302913 RepID=A0A6A6GCS2_9PEZI|nr:hypothetical protein BDZ85DRAFT_110478 [Elsinoe ampelina]